jgi:hypothetical protein
VGIPDDGAEEDGGQRTEAHLQRVGDLDRLGATRAIGPSAI